MSRKIFAIFIFTWLTMQLNAQKPGSTYRFRQAPMYNKLTKTSPEQAKEAASALEGEAGQWEEARASVVVLKNENQSIPIKDIVNQKIAYLNVGMKKGSVFEQFLRKYADIHLVNLPPKNVGKDALEWAEQFKGKYDLFIIGLEDRVLKDQGYLKKHFAINALIQKYDCLTVVFGGQKAFQYLRVLDRSKALLVTSDEFKYSESIAAQVIFGGLDSESALRRSLSRNVGPGQGELTQGNGRLGYSPPEIMGVNGKQLDSAITAIVNRGLDAKAYPGAQVLVAKKGNVIYHKTFGYHTYDLVKPVQLDDIYDFASLTKVTSALPALMKFYGEKRFDLDAPLAKYFPKFKSSNKKELTFRAMLAHNAQLMPWIPYWRNTVKEDGTFKNKTFERDSSENYNVRVLENLWLHRKYKKKIYKAIKKSPLNEEPGYVYSGLLFYLLPEIVATLAQEDFETYLKNTFYRPIGANTITYNAYQHFPLEKIIPTEKDTFFRKALLHGTVHDEGAAMMGGVSGNAGLFGSANDLAKLMQVYLKKGFYGGQQIIPTEAVEEFIRCQFCEEGNHRGLGFDKPHPEEEKRYTAKSASESSFGHSGYTGTFAWVDPAEELIFIFFSNRVYPTRDNRKLYELNIRPDLHQAVYDAIE